MRESSRHRHAFALYYRLGAERTLERLHAELTAEGKAPSLRTLHEWSRQLHWQDRLADIEAEARAAEDTARIAAVREMGERQTREALLLQQAGMEWLTALDPKRATADAAIRAIAEGSKLERLARGEPTEHIVQDDRNERLEALSDKELDRLIEIAEGDLEGEVPPESE